MNMSFLIGRLIDDPRAFYDQNHGGELTWCAYTLAVQRGTKKGGSVDYIPVIAFDHSAKFAVQWFKKGMRVAVHGPIRQGYKANKDGTKAYTYNVVAISQEFADGKTKLAGGAPEDPAETEDFMKIANGEADGMPFN